MIDDLLSIIFKHFTLFREPINEKSLSTGIGRSAARAVDKSRFKEHEIAVLRSPPVDNSFPLEI